jgi:hypothetical protein
MTRYGDYSLTELENMIPWEFDIHALILYNNIKKENERRNKK